jgi:hypothetical protein
MIAAQTLCVCREGKPVPTYSDHALGRRKSIFLRIGQGGVGGKCRYGGPYVGYWWRLPYACGVYGYC